jgi:peptidoglycan hydrolase-like protein with peptidoglycan-binding domain
MTQSAVKKFQEANNLTADGIVGPDVNAILNKTILNPEITSNLIPVAKTTGSYNLGTSLLKNGSSGEAVRELQRFLNDTLNLGLVIDGKLGPKTIAVIKEWQKSKGLDSDGIVGPKTKALMK